MTLSNDAVIDLLNRHFVCALRNIKGKTSYAGSSNTHLPEYPAIEVTNCAGHHNVQMFFMTSDGRVLHCLPGYWSPRHFRHEAELALEAGKVYYRKDLSAAERNRDFLDLHLRHALAHTQELRDASHHQGFDKRDLEKRKESDFQRKEGFLGGLKTADQVMHERLAERPYAPFESFDVAAFIDMGLKRYQYDHGVPGKGAT
ncbi:MAG: hypothetical protein HY721_20745 [Planctomycetes bacterium]|nr:hypothetical protein [Planctomycetota bacterium]